MRVFARTLLCGAIGCVAAAHSADSAEDPLIGQELEIADEAGNPRTVRIDSVEIDPADREGDTYLYSVSVHNPADDSWDQLCEADREGVSKAIALAGHWDRSGRYHASDRITFACTNGVLAKCARWGYKPWQDQVDKPMRALHQTCTRMARADYCGDGRSHTKDGTPINIFDVFGVQTRDQIPDMSFEAAWGPDGAVALARGRFDDAASIIAECPEKLADRHHADSGALNVQQLQQLYPDALLFNDSRPVQ